MARANPALNRSGYSLGQLILKPSELRPMYTAVVALNFHRGTTCTLMSGWRRSRAVHGDNHIETLVGSEVAQGVC